MARIRLRERQTRAKYLPEICMVCGEESQTTIRKNFSWFPPWVGITILLGALPYIILVAVLTKRMVVEVPVCQRHTGYFWKRTALIWLALLVSFAVGGLGLIIAVATAAPRDEGTGIMITCFAFIICLVLAIIFIAIVQNTTVRPKEITDREISLIGVNDDFAEALDAQRDERRSSSRRDDLDDDELDSPPRRRRPAADEPRQRERFRDRPDDDEPPRRRRREEYDDD